MPIDSEAEKLETPSAAHAGHLPAANHWRKLVESPAYCASQEIVNALENYAKRENPTNQ
jgi:hypothetical protein